MYCWHSTQTTQPRNTATITGMISFLFILLVTFLINNNTITVPGMGIALPQLNPPDDISAHRLIIAVKPTAATEDGDNSDGMVIYFNNRLLKDLEELATQLQKHLESNSRDGNSSKKVVLCADKDLKLESLLKIAEITRARGVELCIATEPQNKSPRGIIKQQ